MVIHMNDSQLTTLDQIRDFLTGASAMVFTQKSDDAARYRFIAAVLTRFRYAALGRADKGLIRRYLMQLTGYSRAQTARLVREFRKAGMLTQRYAAPTAGFRRKFTAEDVRLLAEVDTLHGTLSGPATRVLLERATSVYGDGRFQRLAGISVAHLYNLRQLTAYRRVRRHWTKTRPTPVTIGIRKPPCPEGRPGFIRIDSVHQGDQDGLKGVYHINAVDTVTVATGGDLRAHQRGVSAAGAEGAARRLPFCDPGVSFRQRLGIYQPLRCANAGQAAGGIHQVPPAPEQ